MLTTTLAEWERDRDLSGSALLTRGGETLFDASMGYADRAAGTRVSPATRFGTASVTKMFTAVAITDLVATGHLAFESSVLDLLPAGRRPSTLLPEVTVHHLLCHTSGIADYFEEEDGFPGSGQDYAALWETRPVHRVETPVDFLPMFGDLPPYRPPGERHQYSNAGYIVLALVAEQVTGQPFPEVVRQRVFDRAGMDASGFFRLDEAVPDVAVGYLPRPDAAASWRSNVHSIPVVGGGDGGAFTTARDLDRFLRAYADGTLLGDYQQRVLSPHAAAEDGFFAGYGVLLYPDGRYGHGGADPGVSAIANRWPEDDVNAVVLCNVEDLAGEVRDLMVQAWRG